MSSTGLYFDGDSGLTRSISAHAGSSITFGSNFYMSQGSLLIDGETNVPDNIYSSSYFYFALNNEE